MLLCKIFIHIGLSDDHRLKKVAEVEAFDIVYN